MIMFSMLGLGIGLSVKFKINVMYALRVVEWVTLLRFLFGMYHY